MKKIFFAIVILLSCNMANGQVNVNDLFKTFSKEKGVERVEIGRFVMKLVSFFEDIKGVERVEVISLDNCSREVKDKFKSTIKTIKDPKFETMVNSNEGGENTKILVEIKNEEIRDLVVVVSGTQPCLVRISGKIKTSDINGLTEKYAK